MRSLTITGLAAVTSLVSTAQASLPISYNVTASNYTVNSQVRLAYYGDSGMHVSWNTYYELSHPAVRYGFTKENLNMTASSDVSKTYDTSLTYNNHVLLYNLLPHTQYFYMPEDLLKDDTTEAPYSFFTSRPAGDMTPYSTAFVADMGTMGILGLTTAAGSGTPTTDILAPGEQNTIGSLTKSLDEIEFLHHNGDIAYADYALKELSQGYFPNFTIADVPKVYENVLNAFYDELTPITTTKPYMVGPGNHEANCDNGGVTVGSETYNVSICVEGQRNFTGYRNHFRMPGNLSGGTENMWYSYDYGMAHFIQLSTETDLGEGYIGNDEVGGSEGQASGPFNSTPNAQHDWLEADLAKVDRSKTPWVIALGHRPWYLSHTNASGTICWTCKDVFEPLLIKYNVDLVYSGHSHVYERNAPMANGVVDPNELDNPTYPWYITNGMAGHYDGLDPLNYPLQTYSRFALDTLNGTYAWSKISFHNCTHMTHELIASNNNSVIDSATLYKARNCSAPISVSTSASSSLSIHTATTLSSSSIFTSAVSSAKSNLSSTVSATNSNPTSTASSSKSALTSTAASYNTAASYTTSTVYSTNVYTVTSCPATVTSCPAHIGKATTEVISLYTTICPVTAAEGSTTKTILTSTPSVKASSAPASVVSATTNATPSAKVSSAPVSVVYATTNGTAPYGISTKTAVGTSSIPASPKASTSPLVTSGAEKAVPGVAFVLGGFILALFY